MAQRQRISVYTIIAKTKLYVFEVYYFETMFKHQQNKENILKRRKTATKQNENKQRKKENVNDKQNDTLYKSVKRFFRFFF